MAKKIYIRPNYQNDANFFNRLADSIAKDESQDVYWRADVIQLLKRLAILFERVAEDESEKANRKVPGNSGNS